MGLFDFIFKKKETVTVKHEEVMTESDKELLQEVEVSPGILLPKALAKHWAEIEKTKQTYVSIKATQAEKIDLRQSSFGYYPCLPLGFPYPTDANGNYMYPLAQINFSEVPVLDNYPKFGYLQFYIPTNDTHGLIFDRNEIRADFKVLYFEEDEVKEYQTDFSFLGEILNTEYSPVYKPHKLEFSIKEEYFGISDVRSEKAGFDLSKIANQYPKITDELEEYVWENFPTNGHKIGGYAYFTQEDPRADEQEEYVLLLQIDTDEHIMWGDSGVGNFFIHPDDLAKKDFSKVFYTWDCC